MESSRKLGGSYSTKHAGVLLRVDAIFLSEALDTVRSILLPCWAHYSSNIFPLSLDKTNTTKSTRRQSSSAPSPNLSRQQKLSHGNRTGQMPRLSFPSYLTPAQGITSMRTWPEFLLTRSELYGSKLAGHLDNDRRLLCFTQEQQRCLAQPRRYTLSFSIPRSFLRRPLAGEL